MGWVAIVFALFVVPMLVMAVAVWISFRLVLFAVAAVFGVVRGAFRLVVR